MSIATILLLLAVVCFLLSAVGVNIPRVSLLSLGLAFFAGAFLVGRGLT